MGLEYSIAVAGVTLEGRPADPDDCILLQRVTGLDGRERRMQTEAVAGHDGDVFGPATRAGITLTVEAVIVGPTPAGMRVRERALRTVLEPVDAGAILTVQVLGRSGDPAAGLAAQMRVVAPLRAPDGADETRVKPATFAVAAEAATWQGDAHLQTILPPLAVGGLSFPFVFPISFGGSTSPGDEVVNAGNAKAWPILRVYGYSLGPVVENLTTGEALSLSTYTLPEGAWLEIDTRPGRRTVMLGGTASVYSALDRDASSWWGLVPGSNLIRFRDAAHSGTARLDVDYADAYS